MSIHADDVNKQNTAQTYTQTHTHARARIHVTNDTHTHTFNTHIKHRWMRESSKILMIIFICRYIMVLSKAHIYIFFCVTYFVNRIRQKDLSGISGWLMTMDLWFIDCFARKGDVHSQLIISWPADDSVSNHIHKPDLFLELYAKKGLSVRAYLDVHIYGYPIWAAPNSPRMLKTLSLF